MTDRNPADLPAADLRHELETLRAMALEYHRARAKLWTSRVFGTLLVALRYDSGPFGLRLRVMLAPREYRVTKRDATAVLEALGITTYQTERLPGWGHTEIVIISEAWHAAAQRPRTVPPAQPTRGSN